MRTCAALLLLLLALGRNAAADPPASAPIAPSPAPTAKPPSPLTPEQAADAVLAAVGAKDEAGLKALATKDDPDPWLVADELVRRQRHDEAEAFANAAPRKAVEALAAYVASRRASGDDPARRTRLTKLAGALSARKPREALEAAGGEDSPSADDVVGIQLAFGRAAALRGLTRHEESARAFLGVADVAERRGWLVQAARALHESGMSAVARSDLSGALATWQRRLAMEDALASADGAAGTLVNLGSIHSELRDFPQALACYERGLALAQAVGQRTWAANALGGIAIVHSRRGEYTQARATLERALAVHEAMGDEAGVARVLTNLGIVSEQLGDYPQALAFQQRSLELEERAANVAGIARGLVNLGLVYGRLGDHRRALALSERALPLLESTGDRAAVAQTLGNIGNVHARLGDYGRALQVQERALALSEACGSKVGVASALVGLGILHWHLGDLPQAVAHLERGLASKEALGDKAGIASALDALGVVHGDLGDDATALSLHERALAIREALGDRAGVASALGNVGMLHARLGETAKALTLEARALALADALGDKDLQAGTLANVAFLHAALGELPQALAAAERSVALAEAAGGRRGTALALNNVATIQANLGRPAEALRAARDGVTVVLRMAEGLAEGEAAGARDKFAELFGTGAQAAVALDDRRSLAWFLEQGRAGSLREGLGSREAFEAAVLPEGLRRDLLLARAADRRALAAYRRAAAGDDRAATRAARATYDASQAEVERVTSAITRTSKAAGAVALGAVDELETLERRLAPDEALVLYGFAHRELVALVIRRGGSKIVRLGTKDDVEAAAAALLASVDGAAAFEPAAADALRRRVVDPLALGADVRRVLVSPTGELAYVPFTLLLPEQDVAYVPSGTTHGLLLAAPTAGGDGILAIGDPAYGTLARTALALHRGAAAVELAPLPATRGEVEAVGTVHLLGGEASEAALADALARRERWRAVHFACHGRVDPERPLRSSLALSADDDNDGFLTALEVFRMRVPADLVVMSACETGRGKLFRTEGIVGLTQAFMYAGAPRVICSLWKVDDAATRVLMTKFYELWNPRAQPEDPERAKRVEGAPGSGLPAAQALREAQAFVRSHEKWKHPYYWAAWVLWGLPS